MVNKYVLLGIMMSFMVSTQCFAASLPTEIKLESGETNFCISGTASIDGWFKSSDRFTIFVLEPNGSFETEDYSHTVYYGNAVGAFQEGEKFEFQVPFEKAAQYGKYPVRFAKTDLNGKTESFDWVFFYLDPQRESQCVMDFVSVSSGDLLDLWAEYLHADDVFNLLGEETLLSLPSDIGTWFCHTRDLILAHEINGEFNSSQDVIDNIKRAYVMSAISNGRYSDFSTAMEKYGDKMEIVFDTSLTTEKMVSNFQALKQNISDPQTFKSVLKWSEIITQLQNGTRKTFVDLVTENADFLGVDLDDLNKKGVSLESIAVYLNNAEALNWYGDELWKKISAVANEIQNSKKASTGPVSVGSSGGGSGSKTVISKELQPNVAEAIDTIDVAQPIKAPFSDLDGFDWALEHITELYQQGALNGRGHGGFEPASNITREEFLKIVVETLDIRIKDSTSSIQFIDCLPSGWYYPYIDIAVTNKIITGIDKQTFGIGNDITRQDAVVILKRALDSKGKRLTGDTESIFIDKDDIPDYAKEAVRIMSLAGVVTGFPDQSFRPSSYITRAQAAVMVNRIRTLF